MQVIFSQSPVLAGMKGLQTKDSRGEWPHEIRLEETAEDVALLLLYMYKQAAGYSLEKELTNGSHSGLCDAERLVKIAHRLDVQHLLTHLDSYLVRYALTYVVDPEDYRDRLSRAVDQDAAYRWLYLADQYHLPKFSTHCQIFFAEHFKKAVTYMHVGRLQKLTSEFLTKVMERIAVGYVEDC